MLSQLDANGALLCAAVGLVLICAEFCLPGWVIPGVAGGVFLICGAYRLSMLDAGGGAAAALATAVVGVGVAGYGLLPEWLGLAVLLAVPWLCRSLVPGAIQWPVAAFACVPAVAAFFLLRVAARAAANKTLLQ
ncbi:MAG: hypothetical protein ACKV2U_11200 [Bryobacteraceae bacterium]